MRLISRCFFLLSVGGLIASALFAQTSILTDLQIQLLGNSRFEKGFTVEVTDATGAAVPDAAIVFRLPDSNPTGTFPDRTHASVAYTDRTGHATIPNIQWNPTPGLVAIRVSATKGIAHASILVEQTLTAIAPGPSAPVLEPGVLATAESPASPLIVPLQQSPDAPAKFRDTQPSASPNPQAPSAPPAVTVTGGSPDISTHSAKKWIIIVAIAAGAGVGIAMAMGGKKGNSTTPASTLSIGTPSVSVGQ